jgi:hypothetical protein
MTNETFLDTWYDKLTAWYLSKPWYLRILCIGLVAVIVFLFLFRFIARGTPKEYTVDVSPVVPPSNPTAPNDAEEVTNAEKTLGLKKQLIKQLEESEQHQGTYTQQASEINNAQTMEELDALRKKFNL